MTKFKVGDIVIGNQDNKINGVKRGHLYKVVATEVAGDYDYIMTDLSLGCWVLSERFDLYRAVPYQEEQDDPLPPAPESVRYYDDLNTKWGYLDAHLDKIRGQRVVLALNADNDLLLLSADAARQLAHDLNRMAMEIKRQERARSGE